MMTMTFLQAIKHTPTALELYWCKSRILKHCGSVNRAADTMASLAFDIYRGHCISRVSRSHKSLVCNISQEAARRMDLADRYINTKATKYHLRANRLGRAADTAALFVKQTAAPESTSRRSNDEKSADKQEKDTARAATHEKLHNMQCSWYELEAGEACERKGNIGQAMKFFSGVIAHFDVYKDDQFDFHTHVNCDQCACSFFSFTVSCFARLSLFGADLWLVAYCLAGTVFGK